MPLPTPPPGPSCGRKPSVGCVRANLAVHQKQAASSTAAERKTAADKLSHWLQDSDLFEVRPGSQRTGLAADERAAWDALWADVKATLAEAQKPAPA